jgi:aspartyl-tRNA(Asn)/glutamyl-tRNA(Gln) amidotransferase subunit B
VLDIHADKVTEYKNGKDKLFGFFVGQTMQKTQGKANPQILNEIIKELLEV